MYCNNCGKLNPKNSNFCQYCDYKFADSQSDNLDQKQNDVPVQSANVSEAPKKGKKSKWKTFGGIVLGLFIYICARVVGQSLGITTFILILTWLIGYWLARWLSKKHLQSKLLSIIAWVNLVSWFIPILGFLTAGVTYLVAQKRNQKKYYALVIIAVTLSIITALYYTYNSSNTTTISSSKVSKKQIAIVQPINKDESVVNIVCDNGKGGSGTIFTKDGMVLTNNHVIEGSSTCVVSIPDPETGAPSEIYSGQPLIVPNLSPLYDIAVVKITGSYVDSNRKIYGAYPTTFPAFTAPNACNDAPQLSDPITIYGYPVTSGGENLTITQGIISSFSDNGNILTTAQVDSGNSGGLAINAKTGCMVGIPSAVAEGNYQNLGVIIPSSVISDFIDKATSEKISFQSASTESTTATEDDQPSQAQQISPEQQVSPTEPQITCTGPDGKQFQTTQEECDAFNAAWAPTPTPDNNFSGF